MRHPPVVVATHIDVEYIDTGLDQFMHVLQRHVECSAAAEFLQEGLVHDFLGIGFLQGQRQIDSVHDRVVRPDAFANLLDDFHTEAHPVAIASELAAIERGVGDLFEQIAFVAVQIDAVKTAMLGVRGALTHILDDLLQLAIAHPQTGNIRNIVVGIDRGRLREFELRQQTLRIADAAETRRQLNENA